jgi:ParB-like nuclease domain
MGRDELVVDVTYQREIGRRGAVNVNQIAENFDWSKFAPVIVAPVEGGQFAIVDGQHRTAAAMLRGQEKVPCQGHTHHGASVHHADCEWECRLCSIDHCRGIV